MSGKRGTIAIARQFLKSQDARGGKACVTAQGPYHLIKRKMTKHAVAEFASNPMTNSRTVVVVKPYASESTAAIVRSTAKMTAPRRAR
jgi:hypothetical protein